jgi:hypothetical protein
MLVNELNLLKKFPSGAKQAAEKGLGMAKEDEKRPPGPKGRVNLSNLCVTAEAVTFQNIFKQVFFRSLESPASFGLFTARLKSCPFKT